MHLYEHDHSLRFTAKLPPKVLKFGNQSEDANTLPRLMCSTELENMQTEESTVLGSHVLGQCLMYKLDMLPDVWAGQFRPWVVGLIY